jgi:hypothetical protein
MDYWSFTQIKNRVEQELVLQDEDQITSQEIMSYTNEAIDIAEGVIMKMNEDYFLADTPMALADGAMEYALPTNIYGQKIRALIYQNGANIYEIKRARSLQMFLLLKDLEVHGTSEDYRYLLVNKATTAKPQLRLYPKSRETSAANVTMWYIRHANRITTSTDVCDIPEWYNFVIQYVKMKCLFKQKDPGFGDAKTEMMEMRAQMEATLSDRTPDESNQVLQDLTPYQEMS